MTVLITGASSGIGRSIAKYLDSLGDQYQLVLVARRESELLSLQSELQQKALVLPFDLNRTEDIEDIFRVCKEKGIKFDGLVHSAGVGGNIPIRNISLKEMESVMQTNYYSFMELGRCFSLRKYSNDAASIVAISSISPLVCYTGAANYAASKAAVNTAVRIMAKEFMRRKIRVNAVCPAMVNTAMGPAEDDLDYIALQPLGIIKREYIAYMVEFLLSDKAKYMTGTLIPISAGMAY